MSGWLPQAGADTPKRLPDIVSSLGACLVPEYRKRPAVLCLHVQRLDSLALSLPPPHSAENTSASRPAAPWAGWLRIAPALATPVFALWCASLASTTVGRVLEVGSEPPGAQEPLGNRTAGISGGKIPECGSCPPVCCTPAPKWDLPLLPSQGCLHFQEQNPVKLHTC